MDDVGPELLEDARQPPRGGEIHLGAGRQRNEIEPLLARGGAARRWDAPPAPCDGRARAGPAPSPAPGSVRRASVRAVSTCRENIALGSVSPRPAGRSARGPGRRRADGPARRCRPLHLEQLHVFQEHVVGVQHRDQQAGLAVAESAAQDVVPAGTPAADRRRPATPTVRRPSADHCSATSVV